MTAPRPRIAVVGHVEWVLFGNAVAPPVAGQIIHLTEPFEEPAGGGAVAAITLARAGADVTFFTALAEDAEGVATRTRTDREGIDLRAASRPGRQARAVTILDDHGDRTIIVSQPNTYPRSDDELGWSDLSNCAAVYATCAEPSAIVAARAAGRLVCSARQLNALIASGVRADVIVGSGHDQGEQVDASVIGVYTDALVLTSGERGGCWITASGECRWDAAPLPSDRHDTYGAGDCFASGLAYGLAVGDTLAAAVQRAAEWGAAAVCRRGPYG